MITLVELVDAGLQLSGDVCNVSPLGFFTLMGGVNRSL